MAELMDKQGILDELRRRSGGAQQEQTPMMDKQQILDYLQKRASGQQELPTYGVKTPNAETTPTARDAIYARYATDTTDEVTAAQYAKDRIAYGADPYLNYIQKHSDQKKQEKEQELADYKQSDEYRKGAVPVDAPVYADSPAAFFGNVLGQLLGNKISTGVWSGDTKEGKLTAEKDYYENLSESAADQKTMINDLSQIASWPEEDKKELEDAYNAISFRGYIYGIATAGLAKKYGRENIANIMESYSRYRNQQKAQEITEGAEKFAGRDSAIANPLAMPSSAVANVAGGVGGSIAQLGGYLNQLTGSGRYNTLDPYLPGSRLSLWGQAASQAYWQKAGENVGDVTQAITKSEKAADFAKKATQTVGAATQSAVENLLLVVATQGQGTLALMGMRGFENASREATLRGASPTQAMLFGLASAGIEAATEKIPLDELLDAAKAGRKGIVQVLKQAGIEATEEELSYIGSLLADSVILQGDSEYNQTVQRLVANGVPYEDAVKKANEQVWQQAKQTALQAALSGGMMSAGNTLIANKQNKNNAQQAATPTQSEETAKTEKVPTQAETPTQAPQAVQTPSQPMTPQQAMQETIAEIIGVPSVSQAVESYRNTGTVSNKKASAIANNRETTRSLLEAADIEMPYTASGVRNAVKQAVAKISAKTVDNGATTNYDSLTNQGGVNDAQRLQQNDRAGGFGDPAQGMARVQPADRAEYEGRQQPGGMAVSSGVLRLSSELQQAQAKKGTPTYSIYDTTSEPVKYEQALKAGRESDAVNGWCVTPKSAQEIADGNVRTIMNENGTVGAGIAPDGDIVAVFKNKNGGPKKALHTLMPAVIEQGGNRLDCYGNGLVGVYAQYGFIPVARVEFNPEYANEGWTPDKGTPYIYFMMHNGDSAATVAEKIGTYPEITKQQLDALPTFGKEAYEDAMAYRDNFIDQRKSQPANPNNSVGASTATLPANSVGAAMPHETKRSRVIENTYANATDPGMRAAGEAALKEDPDIGNYSVIPESESLFEAEQRTRDEADMQREYDYLMEKRGGWTSADNDTAMKLRDYFYQKEDQRYADIVQRQAEEGTQAGQFIQSFAKYTRMTGEEAAAEVVVEMDKLKESDVPKRFYQDGGFDKWKGDVITSSMNIAKQIDSVEDGDVDGMKDIIRSMAKWRKTTAWFGLSSDLSKAAEAAMKDIDFETAKAIANAQLSTLPTDFKKRPVGQVVKTIRIHNMLSALTTINRNLVGNTAVGFIDATSDSTSGRLIDALISKVTGKRTVGNDIKHGKTYMDAAWKATKMASLCAELDIPMDSESRFTTGTTRTYSPQGNPVMRFMSAYEKYMKYALEVTDQFYQGGANAAVDASLQEISGNGTLTQEEAQAVAKLAGQRRTLKDERAATRMAKKVRQGLNEFGTESMGLGDLTMPFASIGSTSAHVAVDYTAGTVTGLAQVFKLMYDVKNGRYVNGVKTIYKNGKPVRTVTLAEAQRAAVTNAGRGITGLGLVTAFAGMAAAGILKVHDDKDKDKRGLEQAQNLSGAQLNIDAALRGLQGKSTDWQNDDLVISVDFLEPFNAQMYLGYLLSQDESVMDAVKSYTPNALRSVMASIADMPAMQGMQEALDILSGLQDVSDEEGGLAQWAADSAGQVIGSTASGFIPGWLRQMAQVIDPYYRDTSGDTATDAAINQVKAAIPGLSQTLPKKYSGLGQEQLRDDDWISGIFNTMVNPGDADRIKTTEVTDFLDELYDLTGDLGIYPDAAAPKSFDQDKKTYTISTKEETETYQKAYGSEVNKLYSEIIKSADFKGLDETDQAAVLEKAKDAARALAKSKISGKYTPPSSIKNKPIYKSDAQAILDAYIEAKKKAEKEAQKEAAKEAYLATKNGQ